MAGIEKTLEQINSERIEALEKRIATLEQHNNIPFVKCQHEWEEERNFYSSPTTTYSIKQMRCKKCLAITIIPNY